MINENRPSLFHYATSELSQDAFICWLAAWADPKWKNIDLDLHQTGLDFVISLIRKKKADYDPVNIKTVDVKRQVEKLDILISINEELPDKLAILVEDKTHTDHHSGQLGRYYDNARKNYTVEQIIPIYFKTGYQSKFDVGQYNTFLRKEFLQLMRIGSKTVKNAIYLDFLTHLEYMEYVVNQFLTKSLTDWDNNDWRGFFIALHENFGELDDQANWNYIANPAGGFFGFWWYFKKPVGGFYKPYLQLENDSLCFKIKVDDSTKRSEVRKEVYYKLKKVNAKLERPKRMGNGLYMTVAKWPNDNNNGYREPKDDGTLAFDATLENLKKAQQILDTAFPV